ncbi:hypothetical protein [Amycolatopsis japonica]
MTMTVPAEQQLTFEATTASEFRSLLGRILDTSPLSCGQIAIKTGMPRSTAYSLPDTKRPGLPSNPDQVRDFVKACGLSPTQIELVMDLWSTLQAQAENDDDTSKTTEDTISTWTLGNGQGKTRAAAEVFYGEMGRISSQRHAQVARLAQLGDGLPALLVDLAEAFKDQPSRRRDTSWTDLMQYVLGSEDRTRRAVRLLIPVTVLLLGLLTALVYLAVRTPTVAPVVVIAIALPYLLVVSRAVRNRRPEKKVDDQT